MAILLRVDELLDACTLHDLIPRKSLIHHRIAISAALQALAAEVAAATGVTLRDVDYDPGCYLVAAFERGPGGETCAALEEQDQGGEWGDDDEGEGC